MSYSSKDINNIKKKLRNLKKLEITIRTGGLFHNAALDGKPLKISLVWDDFFDLQGNSRGRYSLEYITSISREEFKRIVDEFFSNVYYRHYLENGLSSIQHYDPEILRWLGLSPMATFEEIKSRFRELAKKYHPDTGGDSSKFIELMENYKKLIQ